MFCTYKSLVHENMIKRFQEMSLEPAVGEGAHVIMVQSDKLQLKYLIINAWGFRQWKKIIEILN